MQGEDDLRGLAVYFLAAHEVENDIRALNIFQGLRRCKKEGRYMGMALIDMQIK